MKPWTRLLLLPVVAFLALTAAAVGQEAASANAAAPPLSLGGWVFMLASNLFVWVLTLWCFARVVKTPDHVDPGPAAKP